jgi:hypothetical protein
MPKVSDLARSISLGSPVLESDAIGLNVDAVAVPSGLEGDDLHGNIVSYS